MGKIMWLYYRLKAMSLKEVLYRINKLVVNKANKIVYKKNLYIDSFKKAELLALHEVDTKVKSIYSETTITESENCTEYEVFNETIDIFKKINWHKGMYGEWNKSIYSQDIDFKNTDSIGDIRYSWEINRHQFFPYLAMKYKTTKDEKYFKLIEYHFNDWVKNNPFLKGINWASPMEISIRSFQWLITYYILSGLQKEEFRQKLIKAVIFSTKYVYKNLSSYSSANNHLIVEAHITSIIGYCISNVYKQHWFSKCYDILNKQIPLQFHKDGINKEQALHYQAFVTDALLQYNFFLKNIGYKPLQEEIIKKSLIFMGNLKSDKLNFEYGDSDDAKLLSFNTSKINYYKYILELGSIYYNIKFIDFSTIKPEIIFFTGVNTVPPKSYKYSELSMYKEGGYAVISHGENNILIDFGELGFNSLAAHGHADALAFIYYHKTNPIFIDSGTYIYNIEKAKRDFFRSTINHNTLTYNSENQSEIKGPFLWGKKAKAYLIDYSDRNKSIKVIVEQDGYFPHLHRREFTYLREEKVLIIKDSFDEFAELSFILEENIKIKQIDHHIYRLISKDTELYFHSQGTISICDTEISKNFFHIVNTKRISVKHNFAEKKQIRSIISPTLKSIKDIIALESMSSYVGDE